MERKLMLAGEFAKKARVTLATLYHYDKMGLLVPVLRGENGYRYYSLVQLPEVNLIHTLQELGLSLNEIKAILKRRTPEGLAKTLQGQVEKIDQKINGWLNSRKLLVALQDMLMVAQDVDESAIVIQTLPEAPMALGEWNHYAKGEDAYDALARFYKFTAEKYPEADIGYPVWALFTKDSVRRKLAGDNTWPDRYYFYQPDGQERRPAGLYVIGYTRGDYGQHQETYIRLQNFMDENNLEMYGDAYEEYPLNEASSADRANYLVRIMIEVMPKRGKVCHGGTLSMDAMPIIGSHA